MAERPVFFIDDDNNPQKSMIEFKWYPGFALSQKRKSISSLHENIENTLNCESDKILEISTKSPRKTGRQLSAFKLRLKLHGITSTVENFFQSSKVFENGGPYEDLMKVDANKTKKDSRLRESGSLTHFQLFDEKWPNTPDTLFYDWLYMQAVKQNRSLHDKIIEYDFFTDIEFNPKKSINCQAQAAALYVSLFRKEILDDVLNDKEAYVLMRESNEKKSTKQQMKFF